MRLALIVKRTHQMKPLPHHYDVHLTGGPVGDAQISTAGVPALRTARFLFTLRAIARLSKVEFTALELDASGTVDRQDGVTRFTEIVLRPRLTVPAGAGRERVRHVLEKSEKACLVSASLSTPIRLEPEITSP